MNYAGILAGGIGSRMESSVPKQFLKIADIPIVVRTLRTFLESSDIDKVILAMNPQWMQYCLDMLDEYNVDTKNIIIISGGETRFLSMVNIVDACIKDLGGNATENDFLCIHDCARPFVSQRIISDNFKMVKEYDMVTTSLPTIDTVLIAENGKESTCVPERSTIFCDQGPQTFNVKEFKEIQVKLTQAETDSYMEAGRMYLEKGFHVGIVEGDRMNFKITTEFDMVFAELLMQNQNKE
ncbi:MAG: 2-C-methyl-D-erythritol 4-phosphate cytidylyltransferase [Clostridia bacterium]|nr:2-C-methyl-D-erythritol 4-phosphate cytidylyltransferase [Clostridia bacterium]MBR3808675.1 2-C-methyl-D-erythritol 4-phosphate cytidylyltransferase [Clostridia bacterium]